jgi:NDP-sugar pyrophosphorylase family protein
MSTISLGLILADGNGRRLACASGSLPKTLVEMHDKPLLLDHVLLGAYAAGIEDFVIVVGYHGSLIRSWFECRL